ncbi:hypothetical protein N7520_007834 [Penicillium odoratum]|uniref:uncharacterized protein n=1 Tax=Penicillium odoratum TaxID=1167516 RepID=UPI002546F920|nr:uncharacterized protein N7520_007834 [Penicillium odoratum]KAJ5760678.1 hypothetical protein N7520_007834 [Penicillium odoratum]
MYRQQPPNRRRVTSAERQQIIGDIIQYLFRNPRLLDIAFQAPNAVDPNGNKPMALIGDAALRLVLYEQGYEDNASTETMTDSQNTKATNANLARLGFGLCLAELIDLNPSARGAVPMKLMATTMEALIGAVYLDCGKDIMVTRRVIIRLGILDAL